MKYARLANTQIGEYINNVGIINMGDYIQSFAVENLFKYAGIESQNIIQLPFFQNTLVTEPCYLIVQGHFGRQYDMGFMYNSNIHPIFIGFALKDSFLLREEISYFKKYEPILCRDEFTKNVFTHYGIEAYISGCLSLIFPKRKINESDKPNKYYFVDVKEKFIDLIPKEIKENAVITSQNIHIKKMGNSIMELGEKKTCERLEDYQKNAKMVITSKLHCMIPCTAMGIPTIAVGDNFSYRYTFTDTFINAYDEDAFRNYDWCIPEEKVDIEPVKKLLLDVGVSMINQSPDMHKIKKLDDLFQKRDKWNYCKGIKKQLQQAFKNTDFPRYILWGAAAGGYTVYEALKEMWPENEMLEIVDSFAEGIFAGQKIIKPEDAVKKYPDATVIVSTLSGRESAETFLQQHGKMKNLDYFIVHESI